MSVGGFLAMIYRVFIFAGVSTCVEFVWFDSRLSHIDKCPGALPISNSTSTLRWRPGAYKFER